MSRTISDLPSFSFSTLRAELVAICGGKPREVDDHLLKKTGDRAPNRVHCRLVCCLAVDIWRRDKELLVRYAQAVDAASPKRVLMAATGRPFKDRQSGASQGQQEWANRTAEQILTDMCVLAGVTRPLDVLYYGQQGIEVSQPSNQALNLAPKAEPAAPETEPAPAADSGKGRKGKGR
jgi:hypothetical protein